MGNCDKCNGELHNFGCVKCNADEYVNYANSIANYERDVIFELELMFQNDYVNDGLLK